LLGSINFKPLSADPDFKDDSVWEHPQITSFAMKQLFLITAIFLSIGISKAQTTFSNETDVITFMKDKIFINSDLGVELEFGYISEYNT
jgi:hypothetical protein